LERLRKRRDSGARSEPKASGVNRDGRSSQSEDAPDRAIAIQGVS
jgi:hypothetical protein